MNRQPRQDPYRRAGTSHRTCTSLSLRRSSRQDPYRRAGTSLDKYYIFEIVGVGGMGAVYRAQHELTKVDVAIKILKPDLAFNSQQAVDLFIGEAARTAGLNHPYIVRVTDAGIYADERLAYIAMEWLDGRGAEAEREYREAVKRALDLKPSAREYRDNVNKAKRLRDGGLAAEDP